MATRIQLPGPAQIKVNLFQGDGLVELGYTRNGADITFEPYFIDVPGDENGGDEGPPIDVEFLGETARIRLEFTKYEATVANALTARVMTQTAGVPETGQLLFQTANRAPRLLINCASGPINFPRTIPRYPIELSKGTRFSVIVFEFEAHKDATGVLWNIVTA